MAILILSISKADEEDQYIRKELVHSQTKKEGALADRDQDFPARLGYLAPVYVPYVIFLPVHLVFLSVNVPYGLFFLFSYS